MSAGDEAFEERRARFEALALEAAGPGAGGPPPDRELLRLARAGGRADCADVRLLDAGPGPAAFTWLGEPLADAQRHQPYAMAVIRYGDGRPCCLCRAELVDDEDSETGQAFDVDVLEYGPADGGSWEQVGAGGVFWGYRSALEALGDLAGDPQVLGGWAAPPGGEVLPLTADPAAGDAFASGEDPLEVAARIRAGWGLPRDCAEFRRYDRALRALAYELRPECDGHVQRRRADPALGLEAALDWACSQALEWARDVPGWDGFQSPSPGGRYRESLEVELPAADPAASGGSLRATVVRDPLGDGRYGFEAAVGGIGDRWFDATGSDYDHRDPKVFDTLGEARASLREALGLWRAWAASELSRDLGARDEATVLFDVPAEMVDPSWRGPCESPAWGVPAGVPVTYAVSLRRGLPAAGDGPDGWDCCAAAYVGQGRQRLDEYGWLPCDALGVRPGCDPLEAAAALARAEGPLRGATAAQAASLAREPVPGEAAALADHLTLDYLDPGRGRRLLRARADRALGVGERVAEAWGSRVWPVAYVGLDKALSDSLLLPLPEREASGLAVGAVAGSRGWWVGVTGWAEAPSVRTFSTPAAAVAFASRLSRWRPADDAPAGDELLARELARWEARWAPRGGGADEGGAPSLGAAARGAEGGGTRPPASDAGAPGTRRGGPPWEPAPSRADRYRPGILSR